MKVGAATTSGHMQNSNRWGLTSHRFMAAIGFGCIAATIFFMEFSVPLICCLAEYDGYYHIRWGQMLWQSLTKAEFPPTFTWLPLTRLNPHDFADQQLLYHLLLVPFTWGGKLYFGAKLATALLSSIACCSLFWICLRYRIRYALFWAFALLSSSPLFLFRLLLTRANGVSLVLLAISIFLLFERRYRWLAPLAFAYVWAYNFFALLWAAVFLWILVVWWTERHAEWRPIAWLALGTVLGFVINPYFPHDLALFWLHVRMQVAPAYSVVRGGEWYPRTTSVVLKYDAPAAGAMVAGWIAFGYLLGSKRFRQEELQRAFFFLLFSGFLLGLYATAKRFEEYWPPFAVLFSAFSINPILAQPDSTRSWEDYRWPRAAKWALVFVVALTVFTVAQCWRSMERVDSGHADFRQAAEWLRDNVPAGELVFNFDWTAFPGLLYYDPIHTYVSGLDPAYLYYQNPDLGKLYTQICTGKETKPASLIRNRFHAEYVFFGGPALGNDFLKAAQQSGEFQWIFSNPHCLIGRVSDSESGR